jgi:AraC-like DNA-binding protein
MQVLSTEGVAEHERFELWRDLICGVFVQLDCEPVHTATPAAFSGRITARELGPIRVSEVVTSPQHVVRSPRQIARAREDDVLVSLQLTEACTISQDGRAATIEPGDFALYDSARPYTLHMERPFRQLVWQLPRTMLLDRAPALREHTAVRVPGRSGVGAVVSTFLTSLAARLDELSPAEVTQLVGLVADLLASGLGSTAGASVEPSSAARLHLERAKAHIDRRLDDPDLDPAAIAAAVAISPRYLHRLFATEGTSVGRYVLARRLERCGAQLRDPALAHLTVTEIAFRAGFGDAGHFSRTFRRHFGMPPSEYRRVATTGPAARRP